MTKFTKLAAGTLAALTITAGVLAAPSQAEAKWKGGFWGPAIGLGIAGGIIGGRGLRGLRSWLLRWRPGWVPLGCSHRRLGQLPRLREGLRPLLSLLGQEFQSSIGASAPLPPPRRLKWPAPTVPVGAGHTFLE